jgi:hypothetical protein
MADSTWTPVGRQTSGRPPATNGRGLPRIDPRIDVQPLVPPIAVGGLARTGCPVRVAPTSAGELTLTRGCVGGCAGGDAWEDARSPVAWAGCSISPASAEAVPRSFRSSRGWAPTPSGCIRGTRRRLATVSAGDGAQCAGLTPGELVERGGGGVVGREVDDQALVLGELEGLGRSRHECTGRVATDRGPVRASLNPAFLAGARPSRLGHDHHHNRSPTAKESAWIWESTAVPSSSPGPPGAWAAASRAGSPPRAPTWSLPTTARGSTPSSSPRRSAGRRWSSPTSWTTPRRPARWSNRHSSGPVGSTCWSTMRCTGAATRRRRTAPSRPCPRPTG